MSLVQEPPAIDYGGIGLEDLVLAGDDNAWALEDWAWDGKNFTATRLGGPSRGGKRHCTGLHGSTSEQGQQQPLDGCPAPCCRAGFILPEPDAEPSEEPLNSPSSSHKDHAEPSVDTESSKGTSLAICQVEGCNRDVSGLSTYYQRCRICEIHIKEPQFLRQGKLQRFCQQCGRCHELTAFQGSKRSCREQLAKHNARRRRRSEKKSPPQDAGQQLTDNLQSFNCQSRLEDAFASLEAFQAGSALSQPMQAVTQSPAYPVTNASYVPVSFPAASLAATAPAAGSPLGLAREFSMQHPGMGMLTPSQPSSGPHNSSQAPQADRLGEQNQSIAVGIPVSEQGSSATLNERLGSSSLEIARALLSQHMTAQPPFPYHSENLVMRLSIKLFNCIPSDLPADLKQQLTGWLKSTPAGAEGYLRPGCVHLVLQTHLLDHPKQQASLEDLQRLIQHLTSQQHPLWREKTVLIDLNGQLALLKGGQEVASWRLGVVGKAGSDNASHEPHLSKSSQAERQKHGQAPLPALITCEPAAVCLEAGTSTHIQLDGEGLGCNACRVLCRSQSAYHEITCHQVSQQSIEIVLPKTLQPGLAWLEVTKGCMLSQALPILICPSHALAKELSSWAGSCPGHSQGLFADVGLLMSERDPALEKQLLSIVARLAEYAVMADLLELVKFLAVSFGGAPVTQRAAEGKMSLLHICVQNRNHRGLEALLGLIPEQIHYAGPKGITPLHLAAMQGDRVACKVLTAACPEAWNSSLTIDGFSPAHFAQDTGFQALDAEMQALLNTASEVAPKLAPPRVQAACDVSTSVTIAPSSEEQQSDLSDASVDCVVEICGSEAESSFGALPEEQDALLGEKSHASWSVGSCVAWPSPLASVGHQGILGKWSNVALLGIVACLCTCVALVRARI